MNDRRSQRITELPWQQQSPSTNKLKMDYTELRRLRYVLQSQSFCTSRIHILKLKYRFPLLSNILITSTLNFKSSLKRRKLKTELGHLQLKQMNFSGLIITGKMSDKREQRWRSGESTRLPTMWPGFKSWRRRRMWVEFVVGFRLCSEKFFSGYSVFPLSLKTNTFKFQFDLERTDTFKRVHKNS